MTFTLVMIGSKNLFLCAWISTWLCRWNRPIFYLEKEVAECPYSMQQNTPQHSTRVQLAVKTQARSRGTVPKHPVPYQTELYRSVETMLLKTLQIKAEQSEFHRNLEKKHHVELLKVGEFILLHHHNRTPRHEQSASSKKTLSDHKYQDFILQKTKL